MSEPVPLSREGVFKLGSGCSVEGPSAHRAHHSEPPSSRPRQVNDPTRTLSIESKGAAAVRRQNKMAAKLASLRRLLGLGIGFVLQNTSQVHALRSTPECGSKSPLEMSSTWPLSPQCVRVPARTARFGLRGGTPRHRTGAAGTLTMVIDHSTVEVWKRSRSRSSRQPALPFSSRCGAAVNPSL